jgi:hypothetical protein
MNRFLKIAQDFLEENKDILTLPENANEEPNIEVQEPAGNLQSEQEDLVFPAIEWNFFTESDPTTFNEDVTALIEHLASLQVSMDVLEKAGEMIHQNQQPEMNEEQPEMNEDLNIEVAPPPEPTP